MIYYSKSLLILQQQQVGVGQFGANEISFLFQQFQT